MNKVNHLKLKFCLLQITYWCTIASFSGFAVSYMQSKGMSATWIGGMLTASTFGAFAGQFFWGALSDRLRSNKKIFVFANLLMLIMHIVVFYAPSWPLVLITFGILGFVETPVSANLDTWILKIYHNTPHVYGPIRASASFAYAFFTLFYGKSLEKYGFGLLILVSSFFVLLSIVIAINTPDAEVEELRKRHPLEGEKNFKHLVKNRAYLFILIVLFCTGVACAPLLQMIPIILTNVGGNVKFVGYALFANALSQVPFMLFSKKLSVVKAHNRMILAGTMYLLALLLTSIATTPGFIVYCSILNGIGFGLMLPAMREAIFQNTPKELHTTAQSIGDATYMSLAGMVSNTMAGLMVDGLGVKVMILTCSAVQLFAIGLLTGNLLLVSHNMRKCIKIDSGP